MGSINKLVFVVLVFGVWSPFWCIGQTSPCDVNLDGEINILDLVCVANCYDEEGECGWIKEDINDDGQVSVLDLVQIANHFDEEYL